MTITKQASKQASRMPFSHHSHSGQFCSHAEDQLEAIVQAAIERGMEVWCLTEHMPRGEEDLYPDEVSLFVGFLMDGWMDLMVFELLLLRFGGYDDYGLFYFEFSSEV